MTELGNPDSPAERPQKSPEHALKAHADTIIMRAKVPGDLIVGADAARSTAAKDQVRIDEIKKDLTDAGLKETEREKLRSEIGMREERIGDLLHTANRIDGGVQSLSPSDTVQRNTPKPTEHSIVPQPPKSIGARIIGGLSNLFQRK